MNTLSYKGYIGSVEIDAEGNTLYGKVLALPADTMLTYQGTTPAELRTDFEGVIDDYLVFCEENGIEPRKSYSGHLNVRLTPDTHSKVAMLARRGGMSINAFIRRAIDNQIAMLL